MATVNNYYKLVEETLFEKWSQCGEPLLLNEDDLAEGITMLTKIAVKAIGKGHLEDDKSTAINSSAEISSETQPLSEVVDKIKAFVADKAYDFRRVCQTGYPFSRLKYFFSESALEYALKGDSIVFRFLALRGFWICEEGLDERFGGPFQQVQVGEIANACHDMKQAYLFKNQSNLAGFYLLWLIKQATECVYEIPHIDSFNGETVGKVLSDFFSPPFSFTNAAKLVEILHFRISPFDPPLYQGLLDSESTSVFLNFTAQQLQTIPMDKWPGKSNLIIDLLRAGTSKNKLAIANALASSEDRATSAVGNHLLAALTARSLKEAIPHFYTLTERLPSINPSDIEVIFGRPFVEFCCNKSVFKHDPEFVRRLQFNGGKALVHDDLMIGVYDPCRTYKGKGVPPHLLAYDMNSEKMVWGIPLTPTLIEDSSLDTSAIPMITGIPRKDLPGYTLKRAENLLSLQLEREKKLYYIHPETGEVVSTLELPKASKDNYDRLHIGPEGFAYQMVQERQGRILIGGRIIDNQWNTSFEVKTRSGLFRPLSTHCGFQKDLNEKMLLIGPTGKEVTLKGCMAAEAQGDKLYSIEKDPINNQCLLTVRTLKVDDEVVSGIEKSLSLNVKEAFFGKICQNGLLILFSKNFSKRTPIFIDLNREEVTYSQHNFPNYAAYFVNQRTGELWTWDQVSREIWKVSSTSITLMGSLEGGRGLTFLHVDNGDHIYLADRTS